MSFESQFLDGEAEHIPRSKSKRWTGATHTIHLQSPWYEYVQSGEKIYEGRRVTTKTQQMKVGDILQIAHFKYKELPVIRVFITEKHLFPSFDDVFKKIPLKDVLPDPGMTFDRANEIYAEYIPLEAQQKDGIILFKLTRVPTFTPPKPVSSQND